MAYVLHMYLIPLRIARMRHTPAAKARPPIAPIRVPSAMQVSVIAVVNWCQAMQRTCPTRSPAEHTRGWVPLAMKVSVSAVVKGYQAMSKTCPTRSPTADACYTRAGQLLEVLVQIPGSPSGRIS